MSDYHPGVTCEKCRSNRLKLINPLRLHFQNYVQCQKCGHEELEIITFMRTVPAMQRYDARAAAKAQAIRAETQSGSVHESAVGEADAPAQPPSPSPSNTPGSNLND